MLLGFNIGERPLKKFNQTNRQLNYLPFVSSMNEGYSFNQNILFNDLNKISYTFYQGEHYYTEKMESGFYSYQ